MSKIHLPVLLRKFTLSNFRVPVALSVLASGFLTVPATPITCSIHYKDRRSKMINLMENRFQVCKSLTCTLAGLALSGGAMIGLTGTATAAPEAATAAVQSRASCGATFNPVISGARAYWQVNCPRRGKVNISGWVQDTAANGRCAKVRAIYEDGSTWFSPAACPKGQRKNFSSNTRRGSSVKAYLYEYRVD